MALTLPFAPMIPARKNQLFRALFVRDASRRLERSFEGVYLRGAAAARATVAAHPVVCVANHVSWWDALVALVLTERVLSADGYALMDADNLVKLPFFAMVGAIGLDRTSPMDGARAMRHAASLLDRPRRLVWVFPQGRERAAALRPLGFENGAASIAKLVPAARVIPMALRYEPSATPLPRLLIDIGAAMPADADDEAAPSDEATKKKKKKKEACGVARAAAAQERAVESLLADSAEALAREDLSGYERLYAPRTSRIQTLLESALAALTRPFTGVPRHVARLGEAERAPQPGGTHSSRS